MDFIRNKEVKRQIVVNGLLALFWCCICFIVDSKSLWIVLAAIVSVGMVSLFLPIKDTEKLLNLACLLTNCYMEMKQFLLGSFKRASCLFYMMKYPR